MRIILNKAYNSITYDDKHRLNHLYSFSKRWQSRMAVAVRDSASSINTLARLVKVGRSENHTHSEESDFGILGVSHWYFADTQAPKN